MSESLDQVLEERLEQLSQQGRLRTRGDKLRPAAEQAAVALGRSMLDASSNDYLGLAAQPVATPDAGGAGASRLIHGTRPAHRVLEKCLADWLGFEDALLFSSGYAANLGAISALVEADDLVISDRLNHASIIDGCRLSRGTLRVIPHRDTKALEQALGEQCSGQRWVVLESYYSMDADTPNLREVSRLCLEAGAYLLVDEAHALGVFGEQGKGLCQQQGVKPDVVVGTFGKALGLHGAFVSGSRVVMDYLWNRARSFVFSTATSPALADMVLGRVRQVQMAENERSHLKTLWDSLSTELLARGIPTTPDRHGPIFLVPVGDEVSALFAAEQLARRGILTQAIRPPTVPLGSSRLRLTLNAKMSLGDVKRLAVELAAVVGEESGT